ncbi:hypothetical protein BB934_45330 (plasmid) [Microvirga ossetica]|uniref:Uncharacterized protein n=1 Tax=Microvirga ossetica TaxID=1882682 RepID=A0A1B2EZT0_9HYPH|nr:hypothetical protein [Microvirga ossetica]ANY85444.1 hypothetical protein BB934_45330 [Microvirga ossetica]
MTDRNRALLLAQGLGIVVLIKRTADNPRKVELELCPGYGLRATGRPYFRCKTWKKALAFLEDFGAASKAPCEPGVFPNPAFLAFLKDRCPEITIDGHWLR